jgi:hypothetical protein
MRARRWGGVGVCGLVAMLVAVSCGRSTDEDDAQAGGCEVTSDCSQGEQCAFGRCVPIVIEEPGEGGLGGSAPSSAGASSSAGAPFASGGETGAAGEATSAAAGSGGEPASCEPGKKSCDGPTVRVCESDGLGSLILDTCKLSQVCREGACKDIVCVPEAEFCQENAVRACDEDGAGSREVQPCGTGRYCSAQDGKANCGATKCAPDEALCNGGIATQCAADGSGPKPGGTDCESSSQVCVDGQCRGKLCTPGERVCQHDDVYVCSPNGATLELFADCTANEACDIELASCRARLCEPGKLSCDSSRVVSCNALGTGWVQSGTDCAKDDALCVEGSCLPLVCTANATYCQDGDVWQCNANGTKSTLSSDCNPQTSHCEPYYYSNNAYCAPNACTPNQPVCSNNLLTVCKEDGSGPEAGGTNCGADEVCRDATCKAKVCDGYGLFCKDGDIQQCYDSLNYQKSTECGSEARCVSTQSSISCQPYRCQPGGSGCLGNVAGECSEDGESIAKVSQNCGTSGQVCLLGGACAASAIDTLGAQEDLATQYEGNFVGDVIDVYSSRTLTEIQANIVLASPRTLSFAVYEYTGPYNYVSRLAQNVVKDQTGSGYFSSGAMSLALEAGKSYLVVVSATGGGFAPYLDAAPWEPLVSFGRARGALSGTYGQTVYAYAYDTGRVFDFKLTTAP